MKFLSQACLQTSSALMAGVLFVAPWGGATEDPAQDRYQSLAQAVEGDLSATLHRSITEDYLKASGSPLLATDINVRVDAELTPQSDPAGPKVRKVKVSVDLGGEGTALVAADLRRYLAKVLGDLGYGFGREGTIPKASIRVKHSAVKPSWWHHELLAVAGASALYFACFLAFSLMVWNRRMPVRAQLRPVSQRGASRDRQKIRRLREAFGTMPMGEALEILASLSENVRDQVIVDLDLAPAVSRRLRERLALYTRDQAPLP